MKISGKKIDLLQARNNLSTTLLAQKIGITRQNISTIKKRGTCNPTTCAKLAVGLGVDPADLVAEEDNP